MNTSLRAIVLLLPFVGCTSIEETLPDRTATEQSLLSTAAQRSLDQMTLKGISDRTVFLETENLEAFDAGYVIAGAHHILLKSGARVVSDASDADMIAELRSGALSMDKRGTLIGFPETGLGLPTVFEIKLPQLALFSSNKLDSLAKLALTVRDRASGRFIGTTNVQMGRAYVYDYSVMGVPFRFSDLPEYE